jgi:hypothetical protein
MAALSVSDGELRRLEVLRDADRGGLPVPAAAQLLWRSERQVRRLLKAFRSAGAAGLISKKRGRPSNRRTAAAVRDGSLAGYGANSDLRIMRLRPFPKSTRTINHRDTHD